MNVAAPAGARRAMAIAGWAAVAGCALIAIGQIARAAALGEPAALARLPRLEPGTAATVPFVLVALGAALAAVGVVAYVFIPGRWAGLAARPAGRHRTAVAVVAAGALLGGALALPYLLARRGAPSEELTGTATGLFVVLVTTQTGLFLAFWWRILRPGVMTLEEMGLGVVPLDRAIWIGALATIGMLVLVALVGAALRLGGVTQTQAQAFSAVRDARPWELLLVLIAGGVVTPAVEEMLFRGYILRSYARDRGVFPAFLWSSALFAVVHFNLAALAPIFVLGLALALLAWRTGSFLPGVFAHGFFNSLGFIALYAAPV